MPQSSSESPSKRRTSQGEKTYQAILLVAMNVASVEGLDGLTIGRLAKELGMSKSGLFAHFGSKEELQLATINAARSLVRREVFRPAIKAGALEFIVFGLYANLGFPILSNDFFGEAVFLQLPLLNLIVALVRSAIA